MYILYVDIFLLLISRICVLHSPCHHYSLLPGIDVRTHPHSLCGYPPFYNEDNAILFENIMKGTFYFHSPYWDDISKSAKDLIRKLLVVEPSKRLTAKQALKHPWFKDRIGNKYLHEAYAKALKDELDIRKYQARFYKKVRLSCWTIVLEDPMLP